jgi:hypothetical protein
MIKQQSAPTLAAQRGSSSRWFSRQGSQFDWQDGSAKSVPAGATARTSSVPAGKLAAEQPPAAAAAATAVQVPSQGTDQQCSSDQVESTPALAVGEVRLLISNSQDAPAQQEQQQQQQQQQHEEQQGLQQQQQQQQLEGQQLSPVAAGSQLTSRESLDLADAAAAAAVAAAELAHTEEQWEGKQAASKHHSPFKFLSSEKHHRGSSSAVPLAAPAGVACQASSKVTSIPAAAGKSADHPTASATQAGAADAAAWAPAGAAAPGRFR